MVGTIKDAPFSEIDRFHIFRKTDNGNHDIDRFDAVSKRFMKGNPFGFKVRNLLRVPSIGMHFIALFSKVTKHGFSHDARPYKTNLQHFRHMEFLLFPQHLTKEHTHYI